MKMVLGCLASTAKLSTLWAVLLMATTPLIGCIREDESDCPVLENTTGMILRYKYDMNMAYTDKFSDQVKNLQAFVFNSDGVLCDTLTPFVGAGSITPGWERRLALNPGTYSVVTWAGADHFYADHYTSANNAYPAASPRGVVLGVTKLEDFRMFLAYDKLADDNAQPHTANIKELYHGVVRNITVEENKETTVLTSLIKNTNTVKITLTGTHHLGPLVKADDFEFLIQSRNGHYRYDNSTNEQAHLIHYTPYQFAQTDESVVAQIKTMRLTKPQEDRFENGTMLLTVTYKPTHLSICKQINLVDLILSGRIAARNSEGKPLFDTDNTPKFEQPSLEYLDRQDLFEVTYQIAKEEDDKLVVTVYVNEWRISNIYPVPDQEW